jgi:hypothetical protein
VRGKRSVVSEESVDEMMEVEVGVGVDKVRGRIRIGLKEGMVCWGNV